MVEGRQVCPYPGALTPPACLRAYRHDLTGLHRIAASEVEQAFL